MYRADRSLALTPETGLKRATHIRVRRQLPLEDNNKFLMRSKNIARRFNVDTEKWTTWSAAIWILSNGLWVIVVFVLSCFTAKQSVAILQDYAFSPPSFKVTANLNQMEVLPMSTICLPLMPSELDKFQNNSFAIEQENRHYQEAINDFFGNQNLTKENILKNERVWPNSLLFVVHYYLASITQFEIFKESHDDGFVRSPNATQSDVVEAMNILEGKLKLFNIPRNELKTFFGAIVTDAFAFKVIHIVDIGGGSKIENDIEVEEVSFIGFKQVCYRLRFDLHPLAKESDSIFIKANRTSLPNPRPAYGTDTSMVILVDFTARDVVTWKDDDNNHVFSSMMAWDCAWRVPVQIVAVYRAMPILNGAPRCSKSELVDVCKAQCRNIEIQRLCNCTPAAQRLHMDQCEFRQYVSCLKDRSPEDENQRFQCENQCLASCERRTVSMVEATCEAFDYSGTTISFSLANFDYPIFEECFGWEFSSFISVFGGALGLWIGLNLIDIVEYISIAAKKASKLKFSKEPGDDLKFDRARECDTVCEIADEASESPEKLHREAMAAQQNSAFAINFGMNILKKVVVLRLKLTRRQKFLIKKMISFLMWMFLLAATTALTIDKLQEFVRQSTVTVLEVQYNSSMAIPRSTLCLPLFFGELDENRLLIDYRANCRFELSAYFEEANMTKDTFLFFGKHWTNCLRNTVHAYLIKITYWEINHNEFGARMETNESNLALAIELLEPKIMNLNVSVDELRQKFGNEVAMLYSFSVYISNEDFNSFGPTIQISQTKFVSDTQICYQLSLNLYPFVGMNISSNYIVIEFSSLYLPDPKPKREYDNWGIFDLLDRLYVDSSLRGKTDDAFSISFGTTLETKIELSVFRTLSEVNGEIRCSTEETYDDCRWSCRAKSIISHCDCIPSLWSNFKLLSQEKYFMAPRNACSIHQYSTCLNTTTFHENDIACMSKCQKPCKRQTFTCIQHDFDRYDNFTGMYVSFLNSNYLLFEEKFKWNIEALFGEVGGVMGLFFGYCLFDIISLILNITVKISTLVLSKIKKGKIDSQQSSNNKLQHLPNQAKKIAKFNYLLLFIDQFMIELVIIYNIKWTAMAIPIIQRYQEHETMSEMKLILNNPITLPFSTWCVGFEYSDWKELLCSEYSFNIATSYQNSVQAFLNRTNKTKEYYLIQKNWTYTMLYITHLYLGTLTSLEIEEVEIIDANLSSKIDQSVPQSFEHYGEDLFLACLHLETRLHDLNISINELRQKFGRELAVLISLKAEKISEKDMLNTTKYRRAASHEDENKISLHHVTTVGPNYLCYQLPFDLFPFQDSNEIFVVTASIDSLNVSREFMANRQIMVDFSGSNMTNKHWKQNYHNYKLLAPFNTLYQYSMSVDAVYRPLASSGKCNQWKTRENCVSECRIELLRNICRCTPTTWSAWAKNISYEDCKLSDYLTCLKYNPRDDDNCTSNCVGLCERWNFHAYSFLKENEGTRLEFRITDFAYLLFTEQEEFTFEKFTGVLGGAIGFYLGLDFLKILNLVISAITMVTKAANLCHKKTKKQTD